MRYPERARVQGVLRFEPLVRVGLPPGARQEAAAVLAALIATVMEESARTAKEVADDE